MISHYHLNSQEEWTPDSGLVTAAMKLRRRQVYGYYSKDIERMFGKLPFDMNKNMMSDMNKNELRPNGKPIVTVDVNKEECKPVRASSMDSNASGSEQFVDAKSDLNMAAESKPDMASNEMEMKERKRSESSSSSSDSEPEQSAL